MIAFREIKIPPRLGRDFLFGAVCGAFYVLARAFADLARSERSRCPRGAKPISLFSAEKRETVLDAKEKRVWEL